MITQVKLIVKNIFLNLKYIVSNKENIFLILFFLFCGITASCVFVPIRYGFGVILNIVLITTAGIIFSSLSYNWRKSTLHKNLMTSGNNKWNFYLSTLITMLMITWIVWFIMILIIQILAFTDILLINWLKYSGFVDGKLKNIYWFFGNTAILWQFYEVTLLIVLVFSISFATQHLFKSQKEYFVMLLSLMVLSIVFGGALNDYYYMTGDGPKKLDNPLFPWNIYWLNYIFPFYAPSQIISELTSLNYYTYDTISQSYILGSVVVNGQGESGEWWYLIGENHKVWELFFNFNISDKNWNILTLMPYIHISIFAGFGVLNSAINRKK